MKKSAVVIALLLILAACEPAQQEQASGGKALNEEALREEPEDSVSEKINDVFDRIDDSGAIIADHEAAQAFDNIPECWIEKAKSDLEIGYQHTSHGSQIISGLEYVERTAGEPYIVGSGDSELKLRDNAISLFGTNANDLGYSGWSKATENYLDKNPNTNVVMWSWCGQVGEHADDMDTYLFNPAEKIIEEYDVEFIYMTGHLDGTGPDGTVEKANDMIRQHVKSTNGVLFDFADIESYDPNGKYYQSESDACEWCDDWCESHPQDCKLLTSCAHSHGFNCAQKGKAYWWLMARMAGWNGQANDDCP